jgi:endoglucanase
VSRKLPRRVLQLALLALLLLPAAASAAGTVGFSASSYTVRKGTGDAVITVTRSDSRGIAQVRYGVWHVTAQIGIDYTPVSGRIDFANGQSSATFTVPILDDGYPKGSATVRLGLYGAYKATVRNPSQVLLHILDAPLVLGVRNPLNPLELAPVPVGGDPLRGARFFIDRQWGLASRAQQQIRHAHPAIAQRLEAIASQPEAKRFGKWDKDPQHDVGTYLARAHQQGPGTVPIMETYRLDHPKCGHASDSAATARGYKNWYRGLARGVGNAHVLFFMEIDALITSRCLSHHGLNVRVAELKAAIDAFSVLPHAVVYVDAGAADALSVGRMAKLLKRIGVGKIQGFYVNATHFDWTSKEIRFAQKISRKLGGMTHFVVNTAVNGRGPLAPHDKVRHGNELRCTPPGRGLGPQPTGDVPPQYTNLDGLFWIGNPGRAGGSTCGPHASGNFSINYALSLIKHADYRIR